MYDIRYHKLVYEKDFKKIARKDRSKIFRLIHKKLSLNPFAFGKPLSGDLKGYFRLRSDPYRVIYRIEKNKIMVFVLNVGLRKNFLAYITAAKRLKLL